MMIGDGVSAYVSIKDNGSPVLFLGPYIFRDSWLFMSKVAIMVDGDVILDQNLDVKSADREVFPGGIQEHTDFIVNNDQIEALRRMKSDSKVVVRITGTKGYMTLSKNDTAAVKNKIIEVIRVYDLIQGAVKDVIPPSGT
ncbi:hypothetical protein BGV66_04445 [Burkholderia ubonensis]|uniref:Uncharacterized protein n=2 Tax=Burkholderia ubonensis TaxID=101571 RepID=A0ABD6Q9G1_9BURK|nr:hypothetical protein BGV66_04445 [Burkholderia ubonensis]